MSLKNSGGFWRLCPDLRATFPCRPWILALALSLLPGVSQSQMQSGSEFRLDSLSSQPPIQSPTIVTPTAPAATDRIFYQAPVQERQTVIQQVRSGPLERN